VTRIVVVSDEPNKYPIGTEWAPGVSVEHRDRMDVLQRQLRDVQGVSILLYDQTCAAEKRRRRKRGTYPDPPKRVFINELVCEGCGDCSVQSNCLSVVPVETEYGRKRAIDQSSCNKDYSCVNGFCPSFVTVHAGALRKHQSSPVESAARARLPAPELPDLSEPYGILVTGVGGTGVVTIGALLAMAAHIEGKGCSVLDMTGLAQKGGAVVSHVRLAPRPEDLHSVRVSAGSAKLVLGCDLVVAAGFESLSKVAVGETRVVVNSQETITGEFTRNPDYHFPGRELHRMIVEAAGEQAAEFLDATRLATALIGDSIATNLFMMGYAWQKGLVPVSEAALMQAVELNGVAVDKNKQAFAWGRAAAHDLDAVEAAAAPEHEARAHHLSQSLDELVDRRVAFLTAYQDAAYAARYRDLVGHVRATEGAKALGQSGLATAVARYYFKLLAYKDEYEVARLYSDPVFMESLHDQFEGDFKLQIHLAPPLTAQGDPESGHLRKRAYGPWVFNLFRLLAGLKSLRGTRLDPFGYTTDRRRERQLIADYEALIAELLAGLDHDNHGLAVELAAIPEQIRGYGHVKDAHLKDAKAREAQLLEAWRNPPAERSAAE
jgi:indolepyruvate ferredoxin oxidoreductase